MCGIHASISRDGPQPPSQDLKKLLCFRGPDYIGNTEDLVKSEGYTDYLSFTSTVLALRGDHVTTQPFVDQSSGSVLCWNGEAWRFGSNLVGDRNDGEILFNLLVHAAATEKVEDATADVLKVLQTISGPFAFVFWDQAHHSLFFGRDRLGRRSLLHSITSSSIELSSTSDPGRGVWKEVEADAIYRLSLSKDSAGNRLHSEAVHEQVCEYLSIAPYLVSKTSWEVDSESSVSVFFSCLY